MTRTRRHHHIGKDAATPVRLRSLVPLTASRAWENFTGFSDRNRFRPGASAFFRVGALVPIMILRSHGCIIRLSSTYHHSHAVSCTDYDQQPFGQ
jgi:hypothetical protein